MPVRKNDAKAKQRNRKATLAAVSVLCSSHSNCWNIHTMRDYKTVKKKELAKAQLEEQKKALEEASQEASGNAPERQCFRVRHGWSRNRWKSRKSGSGAGTAGTASTKCCNSRKHRWMQNNGNEDGNSQTNEDRQAARTAGGASSANFTSDSKMMHGL